MECSNKNSKTSGCLWQYYRDDPNHNIANSKSLAFKIIITGKTPNNGNTKDVEITMALQYLSNFWRTLEMPLINCETNLILTWSKDCVISSATGETKFEITDPKLYIPVVPLSTQDNAKLVQQLKPAFKRTINWNKYQSKVTIQAPNASLEYLIEVFK